MSISPTDQEYCILRAEAVVRVPPEVDPAEAAPLLCAGVTVFNSMRQMKVMPGETVAIQGLGGLGHLALQYANKMGFRVVALSSSGSKEKFAKDLGAMDYIAGSAKEQAEALQKIGGAAMIVSTASDPKHAGELLLGLQPKGKLMVLARTSTPLLLSPCARGPGHVRCIHCSPSERAFADAACCAASPEPMQISTLPMVQYGLSVHSWPSGQMLDSEEAIAFAQHHNVKCMVEKFPLDKAPEAFAHMMSGKARFRAVITMT